MISAAAVRRFHTLDLLKRKLQEKNWYNFFFRISGERPQRRRRRRLGSISAAATFVGQASQNIGEMGAILF